jgi:DNA-binding HxlR family transcriptional regulator
MRWNSYAAECPTRQLLDRIADKWVVLVLGLLEPGPQRFNALRRQIEGISQKMLTQTLRSLEADGLITRRVFATVPVTVEYQLTPLGRSLNSVLNPLREWAEANMSRVHRAHGKRGVADER